VKGAVGVVIGGAVAIGIALQPRAGVTALVLSGALTLVVRTRFALALLAVLVVAAQFGARIDATPPAPSHTPTARHSRR
jgi:hypothetical protein